MSNGFFGNGFDAGSVPPKQDFVALPAGIYNVVCMDAEWKETKARTGKMLVLTFEVLDGDKKGRKLFTRLNLENQNATAVSIAQSELSSICRAIGVLKPTSEYDLLNRPLKVSVYVDDNGYNGIGNYAAPGAELAEARAPKKKAGGASRPAAAADDDPTANGGLGKLPF
jgi:hypothetical protein